jgi:galactose mutarotase-like enzyme
MKSIANKFLTVQINEQGAELCSIKGADGFEYLWQADPAVWARHAPVLFPIVGKLRNGSYELNGKTYELSPHGFARDISFELITESKTLLVFQLLPTDQTLKSYPFKFALNIIYQLNGNSLEIGYEVQNNGTDVMPFSIGAHPGFTLPGPIDECFLEFEKAETLSTRLLGPAGLISEETAPVLENASRLPLSKTLFDRDALIFMDAKSEKITLGAKNSSRQLTVEFPGFPQLGIWSKPGAPFVCIEPWYGYADTEQPYGDITNKPGILLLPAGETFTCTHRVIVQE